MKKVLLIGDSIRAGYDRFVREAFSVTAQVYYPAENCRFTSYIMRSLPTWKNQLECGDAVDLVHWNAGLWDNLKLVDGRLHTPPEMYRENVGRVLDIIGILFPKAKIIFATSTPVLENEYTGLMSRTNADIVKYNRIATEVCSARGIEINDLYSLLENLPRGYHSDQTHYYTREATELIAGQVISVIGKALQIQPKALDYDEMFRDKTDIVGF